ncbi:MULTISPECIES: FeoA family protein [Clostridium]|uniref:Ferrous iron transport protein A n=1 Tax=Clostridium aciditolerans TaxID=339861 RepID=A0A934HU54_9CLOT|nr:MULTISPECIES: ferrous iron transport protein A [Clostridium]MBI6871464.1 ferrous iron transport protein A [Clostridium aciditolerans]WML34019.1 ferrous iron transport protein A [Clostridium sp. OS1-26]
MSICDLRPGQKALIENISGDEKLAKRLLALGCIEGTEVALKTVAPFGDPLIINLRGFDLAIRKQDAKNIFITNSR